MARILAANLWRFCDATLGRYFDAIGAPPVDPHNEPPRKPETIAAAMILIGLVVVAIVLMVVYIVASSSP